MNITLLLPDGDLDLRLTVAPDATIGDLLDALRRSGLLPALAPDAVVTVDGVLAPADHGLGEVACGDGARLAVGPRAGAASRLGSDGGGDRVVQLVVAGGLTAGRTIVVPAGRHRIGRGSDALLGDPTIQDRHATVDVGASGRVTVTDHVTRGGSWLDGRPVGRAAAWESGGMLRTGAVTTRLLDAVPDDRPRSRTRAFNRPPRPAAPPAPEAVAVPPTPAIEGRRPNLPLASVVGGLAMGGAMWLMTGTATYAVLAFLTPLLGVATAVAARRRHGREQRSGLRAHRAALVAFAADVASASDAAAARLRAVHPDLGEVVRRATGPSTRLWERRPTDADACHLVLGHATRRWTPPLTGPAGGAATAEEVPQILAHEAWLREVPVVAPGGVVGIVGDRRAALAVARGLVAQACVHHGPADLAAVLVTPDELAWDAAKWLPHLTDPRTGLPRAAGVEEGRALLGDLLRDRRQARTTDPVEAVGAPVLLCVLDGVELCQGRDAPGRAVLRGEAGPVLGIVLAPSVDRLPSCCDTVVVLEGQGGAARVVRPAEGEVVRGVLASGMPSAMLAEVARGLARLDDPEATDDHDLPTSVALPDLFVAAGVPAPTTADAVAAAWAGQRAEGRLRVPLGAAAGAPLVVDLVLDGPHALVAGTTGAGKSELLRSLVAGLAAQADPDHVAFVLIDYKGGAAFDRCAELPHVVGLVTDLDDDLAERALVCLQAELHRRERLLRTAGVGDLDGWRRTAAGALEPLPSLVVVIDEFATLAAELPDFLDALVGIAQRGRSLGVHLVLATQRPAGVVSDDIRANTNLRIALRVQDRQDSTDVIEDPSAATLTRDQPGRAFVRLGPGAVVPIQTALVTGPARHGGDRVDVAPFGLLPPDAVSEVAPSDEAPTDLDVLVDAVRQAFARSGLRPPREPWPAALEHRIELGRVDPREAPTSLVAVGIADDPANQRRLVGGWDLDAGSLLLVGALGTGTTSTLAALALQAARRHRPQDVAVLALDAGRGGLAPLAALPHVGDVVRLGDQERLARLVARLLAEVERRRRGDGPTPGTSRRLLFLVDDWEAVVAAHDRGHAVALLDDLQRVIVEGPGVGILTAMTVGRPGGVGARLLASFGQRWVFRLPDDADALGLGVRGTSGLVPGRCIDTSTGRHLQVGAVEDLALAVDEVAATVPPGAVLPRPVDILPSRVHLDDLGPLGVVGPAWRLPVGIGGDDLGEAALHLHVGDHALVLGPARSGRTTTLVALAASALAAGVEVVATCARGGALAGLPGVRLLPPDRLVSAIAEADGPARLVLVDDAELLDPPGMDVALATPGPKTRVVVAARADAVRSAYGHWLRTVARSGVGFLLAPDLDLDGDLLGVRLPRARVAPGGVGRGFLVQQGVAVQCQGAVAVVGRAAVVPSAA